MSGSSPPPPQAGSPAADPSMEDILASIRRILSEDESDAKPADPAPPSDASTTDEDDVFPLDASMIVHEPESAASPAPKPAPSPLIDDDDFNPPPLVPVMQTPEPAPPPIPPPPLPSQAPLPTPGSNHLVAPEAAAAAAASVGSLLRTLIAERETIAVHRGGPTIEDVVREEMRPILKLWLDTNLPNMVERLVRQEIERVVGRATS